MFKKEMNIGKKYKQSMIMVAYGEGSEKDRAWYGCNIALLLHTKSIL
jgi:hypothetical protein